MVHRPAHIQVPPPPSDPLARPLFAPHGNLTPQHQTEVPPALSPLDAFAMQGRLLARKFQEENNSGRRLSRLPPITIASEFAKARPTYFRSMSGSGSQASQGQDALVEFVEEDASLKTATEVLASPRPRSHYPQMGQTEGMFGGPGKASSYQNQLTPVQEPEQDGMDSEHYFAMPRSHSPDQMQPARPSRPHTKAINASPPLPPSNTSPYSGSSYNLGPSLLAPPPSGASRSLGGSPSIRAVRADLYEDKSQISTQFAHSMDSLSLDRRSPTFQHQLDVPPSPSIASIRSFGSSAPRPSFNFSRPISRASRISIESKKPSDGLFRQSSGTKNDRPAIDVAYRQDSMETPFTSFSNDGPQTPVSLASDELFPLPDLRPDSKSTSYVYTKYALGLKTKRESINAGEFLSKQINWDDPETDSQITLQFQPPKALGSNSPPSPALTSSPPTNRRRLIPDFSGSPRASTDSRRRLQKSRPTTPAATTAPSSSTVKARLDRLKTANSDEMTTEMHLQRGIELHESGSLPESTYHLRVAANAGSPTAMLLYALACRHGWGMKASPAEGVSWLQKAVDSSQLEVAEDEDLIKHGQSPDYMERRTHKAQFALSVYELGVSYMNGWGVGVDKPLALRCFEVAGNWGDPDALAEAGYCYLEGIGCKKDMKRSASFYRQAETKGVTVAGNSWIHKEKYLDIDDNERPGRPSRKDSHESNKKREKSRTRAFFARKKSFHS